METRILIIEDNEANLDLMAYLLKHHGYIVVTAMDGETGLQACFSADLDLILCDIQLPKFNGFEIIKHYHTMNKGDRVPIIAITAYAMVGDEEKILAAGFDGYLSKPIEPEKFISQIEAFLPLSLRLEQRNQQAKSYKRTISIDKPDYKGTILIVDDNPADLYLSEMLSRSIQLRPMLAQSVTEAFKLLSIEKPDLILSDYHLPDHNGVEFLGFLKKIDYYKDIPFFIISSSIPEEQRHTLQHSNEVEKIIFRPIEPQKFIELIDSAWRKYHLPCTLTNA
jgi:two-component system cell cycle response regulator